MKSLRTSIRRSLSSSNRGEAKTWQRILAMGLSVTLVTTLQTGCGNGAQGAASDLANALSMDISAANLGKRFAELADPRNSNLMKQAESVGLDNVFENTMASLGDGPIRLGGHTFYNMGTILRKNASSLKAISAAHANVGAYAKAAGVKQLTQIDEAKLQLALDNLDKALNQGMAGQITGVKSSVASPQRAELALSKLGCAGSSVGTAAAVLGTVVACVASLGIGCAAAALGTSGAVIGNVDACKGLKKSDKTSESGKSNTKDKKSKADNQENTDESSKDDKSSDKQDDNSSSADKK